MTDRPAPVEVMLDCGLIWLDANRCLDALEQHGYRIVHESEAESEDDGSVWRRNIIDVGHGATELGPWYHAAGRYSNMPPPQPGTHESDLGVGRDHCPFGPLDDDRDPDDELDPNGELHSEGWSNGRAWSRTNRSQTT